MFFKKDRQKPNQNSFSPNMDPNMIYPTYQTDRLLYEINENRRRINNLAKRIVRLENYLRIRDTSDYSILEEEKPNEFNDSFKY